MHSQVLFWDIASDGHGIENLHEQIVDFDIKALQNLIAERKGLCHVTRLVIASQKDNVLGEIHFYCEQEDTHLNSLNTSVDIVS